MNGAATNRPPNARSGNGGNPSPASDRLDWIKAGISKSRLLCQMEPLTPALLTLTAAAWEETLDAIPTGWIDRAFRAALSGQRGSYPLTAGDVRAAWDALLDERQTAAARSDHQLPAGPVVVCKTCSGKGWLTDYSTGTPGHRDLYRCPHCDGPAAPGRGPEDYTIGALLTVLQAWCAEHRDGLAFPVRLAYALACKQAGAPPYDLRRLLDSTTEPTLYRALVSLGIPVEPPPAVGTHDPRSIGAALEVY